MSAAIAPRSSLLFHREKLQEGEPGQQMQPDVFSEGTFSSEIDAKLATDNKKIFFVVYTDRDGRRRTAQVPAESRSKAEEKFEKTKGQSMVTTRDLEDERYYNIDRVVGSKIPRWDRNTTYVVYTEEEFAFLKAV